MKNTKSVKLERTIEPDYEQLDRGEAFELYRSQAGLESTVKKIEGSMLGLKSAMVIGTSGRRVTDALIELQSIHNLSGLAMAMLNGAVKFCVLVVVLACVGCGDGVDRGGRVDSVGTVPVRDARGVGGCMDGKCKAAY